MNAWAVYYDIIEIKKISKSILCFYAISFEKNLKEEKKKERNEKNEK